jgi:hypothetical protein
MQSGIWRSVAEKTAPAFTRNGFDGLVRTLPGDELPLSPRLTVFSSISRYRDMLRDRRSPYSVIQPGG